MMFIREHNQREGRGTSSIRLAAVACCVCLMGLPAPVRGQETKASDGPAQVVSEQPAEKIALFDGKTLDGWKVTNFGGEGEVHIQDGKIVMEMGFSLTGLTSKRKDHPTANYEIELEAARLDGVDFFCALTFPVHDSHASLIVGGWAGAVVGISCIDDKDASENETTRYMGFKKGQWYRIRLRVLEKSIQAWIDDQQMVDVNIEGRTISTRPEVELSRPLGISAWETRAALRNISIRRLPAPTPRAGR